MTYDDQQILAAVNHTVDRDSRIKNDIKKAIDSHDKEFFRQIVFRVLGQLNRTVSDLQRFVETAYSWFISRMQ